MPVPSSHLRGLVGRDDPRIGEPGGVQRRAQAYEPGPLERGVLEMLVPAADVADGQAVLPGTPEPADHVAHIRPAPQASMTVSDPRSEEHTSELQSHSDLVCRLLLE